MIEPAPTAESDQRDVWRETIERKIYDRLVEMGSDPRMARRLSQFEADRRLESRIAYEAASKFGFGGESRERRMLSDDLNNPKAPWMRDFYRSETRRGKRGKGSRSGGRKRRKPVKTYGRGETGETCCR